MHFPLTRWRVVVAVLAFVGATVLPIRTSWAEPTVRLEELDAHPGRIVDLTHPSSHLGVRWHGEETDVIELRWRAAGDSWQPWRQVQASHDLGDEENGIHLSGLLVATDATDAELRVTSGSPSNLEIIAIDTVHGPRRLVVDRPAASPAEAATADARVPAPPIISRAQWGADESLRGSQPPSFSQITRLSLHHTAAEEGPDPAATVRAILAYHTKANGWNDIGYNFLVDSRGRVYEGRYSREYASNETVTGEDAQGRGVTGAHTANNNSGTVGVAVLGDFSSVAPTRAAVSAVEQTFAWKADRHEIDVLGSTQWSTGVRSTLIGHRDASATACPGARLYELLPSIRSNVNHIVETSRSQQSVPGYWTLGRDSALYSFGDAPYLGGAGQVPTPVMSMATTPTGNGYWLLSANGRVSAYGDAGLHGSTEGQRLNGAVVRLEPTPTGKGYWILGQDGGVFSFGDASFHGSTGAMRLNSPIISMAATVTGRGYWLLAGDGGVFTFGDAVFHGSTGSMRLNAPVVSMAPHPNGSGYWLQAADGGIFTFGALRFYGSVPGLRLAGTARTVQIRVTPTGRGYYVMGADGGIFTFGDAKFNGAQPGMSGRAPAVDLALRVPPPPP
ncbi:MAG TPA: N-acetylmuramoyl-L-alanine amidase, partial [Acidimicrobiales bacterium]|nr:N-acetylmuramoyl-L-alanine amidase [Acidimicrobiales bacterium]